MRYPAKTKIWAAGVAASPLAKMLADACGADVDRAGRIKVRVRLLPPGPSGGVRGRRHDEPDDLPGVAEVALQTGVHAAKTIRRRLDGQEPQPFKYRDLGSMAAISRRRAVVSFHGMRVVRLARLAHVDVRPSRVPHRVQEPVQDHDQLDAQLRRQRPHRARPHHDPRTERGTRGGQGDRGASASGPSKPPRIRTAPSLQCSVARHKIDVEQPATSLPSRRADSNRGPLHYECCVARHKTDVLEQPAEPSLPSRRADSNRGPLHYE